MSEKIAFLFPGQGSQFVGMGKDMCEQFPTAERIFGQADEICKKPISRLCFEGPMEELTLTENLQPAITAANLACLAALNESGITASVSAGHSLGEYSALVNAGVIDYADALRLVDKRGYLMHREAIANPGVMAAVIGLDGKEVEDVVNRARDEGVLSVANYNTADQIVITGEKQPLDTAVRMVKRKGAKVVPLKVSGAWHCALMERAVEEFREFMEDIPFNTPGHPVFFNISAKEETDPDNIKDIMGRQLVSPVRWYDTMVNMAKDGVTTFVEVGPKKVLTGLLRKSVSQDKPIRAFNVEDIPSLEEFIKKRS